MNERSLEGKYAPIALFVFKRPEHTRKTLEALVNNPEFMDSPLFIYCDGARNEAEENQVEETRKIIRNWTHPNITIVERDRNWGLANSVIAGVTELCEKFGKVIVVEDDLVVSPVFLSYMNDALVRYEDEPKVMQISGYMFPIEDSPKNHALMLPITSTWGWATWKESWKRFAVNEMPKKIPNNHRRYAFDLDDAYPYTKRLKQQMEGKSDSWGIRWYWTVFNKNGLVIYPPITLVKNIGNDGSGTHCTVEKEQKRMSDSNEKIVFPDVVRISVIEFNEVKDFLRRENKMILRGLAWLRTELSKRLFK